ncbi:CocE/NonD family hydrolase [Undibacterium baiyunense]|uniref:Xaa-Pro dipeptidyl-peptidase-like domain-containing protein n=1 Tax=Undibacterium baiyunense TaxID=2828731 RepID=A0A941DF92_9BURK|nr:CocE/NonD family hydrolase [Undibacterium baiyunense]MBR7747674.1 hypothetical protein [Undibacterium baiyunense]
MIFSSHFSIRGTNASKKFITPYVYDGRNANTVIDWIGKQSWSNSAVRMCGDSYNGFTKWAVTKKLHLALKTIVPYVAGKPSMGLPTENNIFINPNSQ